MGKVLARPVALGTVSALALCAWCGWASAFHRSTTPATATFLVSLAGVIAVDLLLWRGRKHARYAVHLAPVGRPWPPPDRRGRAPVLVGMSPWLVIFVVVVAWEILGIDTGPHQPHLTISALAQAFRPLAAGSLLVWMLVGIGYGVARARMPVDRGTAPTDPHPAGGASSSVAGMAPWHPLAPALLLPANRAVGVGFWVGLIVVCVLVDLVATRSGGRVATAGELIRQISRPTAANGALILAWAYAGWHLFA